MIFLPNTGNTCGPRIRSRAPLPPCGTARSARRAASRIRRRSPWCSSWSMRRRKAGAGSMATTSCPSSFKVSGSPTGSKSPPTPRPRNPKPPPPDPSGHHQDSAIARVFLDAVGAQQTPAFARSCLPQLIAIELIAERGAVCGDLDRDQTPGGAGLIARGTEFHEQLLARERHCRELPEPGPQPLQLPPPHRTLFGDAVAALGKDIEFTLLRQQL